MARHGTASKQQRRQQGCRCILLFMLIARACAQQQQTQDPMTLNGGSILAMSGRECVAIAVDKRFGSGPQMVNVSPRTVLTPDSNCMVAFSGLEGDVQSLASELSVILSAKMGRSSGGGGRIIRPKTLSTVLSHVLYQRRQSPFYVEPIVAGLERIAMDSELHSEERWGVVKGTINNNNDNNVQEDDTTTTTTIPNVDKLRTTKVVPFLCAQDVIGAQSYSESFVCAGAASRSLYGTAEAMWRPNLEPEELVRVCGKAFLSALERDCLSGYGAIIYLIYGSANEEGDGGIMEFDLQCRND